MNPKHKKKILRKLQRQVCYHAMAVYQRTGTANWKAINYLFPIKLRVDF